MADVREVVVDDKPQDSKAEVSVELDKDNKVVKEPEKKPEEPKYVRAEDLQESIRKSNAAFFAEQRKLQQELQKINERLTPKQAPQTEKPADEWEAKLQTDWKGTVRELARLEAEEIRKREREEYRIQAEFERDNQLRDDNKRKVLERHKELMDETSQKAEIFREVIQEHPEYLPNPFGPVLAMRDMEDKLRERGIMDDSTKQVVDKEAQRLVRAGAGALPKGTSAQGNKKYVLTKDDKEFCDQNNIKYEVYARNKALTASNEGVSA